MKYTFNSIKFAVNLLHCSPIWQPKRITAKWIRNNWADLEEQARKLLWGFKTQIVEKTPYKMYCLFTFGSPKETRTELRIYAYLNEALRKLTVESLLKPKPTEHIKADKVEFVFEYSSEVK